MGPVPDRGTGRWGIKARRGGRRQRKIAMKEGNKDTTGVTNWNPSEEWRRKWRIFWDRTVGRGKGADEESGTPEFRVWEDRSMISAYFICQMDWVSLSFISFFCYVYFLPLVSLGAAVESGVPAWDLYWFPLFSCRESVCPVVATCRAHSLPELWCALSTAYVWFWFWKLLSSDSGSEKLEWSVGMKGEK